MASQLIRDEFVCVLISVHWFWSSRRRKQDREVISTQFTLWVLIARPSDWTLGVNEMDGRWTVEDKDKVQVEWLNSISSESIVNLQFIHCHPPHKHTQSHTTNVTFAAVKGSICYLVCAVSQSTISFIIFGLSRRLLADHTSALINNPSVLCGPLCGINITSTALRRFCWFFIGSCKTPTRIKQDQQQSFSRSFKAISSFRGKNRDIAPG